MGELHTLGGYVLLVGPKKSLHESALVENFLDNVGTGSL